MDGLTFDSWMLWSYWSTKWLQAGKQAQVITPSPLCLIVGKSLCLYALWFFPDAVLWIMAKNLHFVLCLKDIGFHLLISMWKLSYSVQKNEFACNFTVRFMMWLMTLANFVLSTMCMLVKQTIVNQQAHAKNLNDSVWLPKLEMRWPFLFLKGKQK